jgi:hypothetical protein
VDLGCNVRLTLTSRSRAGDFRDIMLIVKMDSVTVVKLGNINMVSPPWKKRIRESLEESVGGLFASLNCSVTIAIEELLPNEGWASVLPKVAVLVQSHSCQHGWEKDKGLEKRDQFHARMKLRRW